MSFKLSPEEIALIRSLRSGQNRSPEDIEKANPPTFGERISDRLADIGGSWAFIISFLVLLVIWIVFNASLRPGEAFDPYPFILLNLVLSCLAAIQAPIIIMAQNRQEAKDRARAEADYRTNLKAETEIREIQIKLDQLIEDLIPQKK